MYLNPPYRYSAELFRRWFVIPGALYRRIQVDLLQDRPKTWNRLRRGCGVLGSTTDVKHLSFLTVLSRFATFESIDHIFKISENYVSICFKKVFQDFCSIYGEQNLNRRPTAEKLQQTVDGYASSGFPGAAGFIECIKLHWENFRLSEKGQFMNMKSSKLVTITRGESMKGTSTAGSGLMDGRGQTTTWVSCQDRHCCVVSLKRLLNSERIQNTIYRQTERTGICY